MWAQGHNARSYRHCFRHAKWEGMERDDRPRLQDALKSANRGDVVVHNMEEPSGPEGVASRVQSDTPSSGKYCDGKTPPQIFLDSLCLARDKMPDSLVRPAPTRKPTQSSVGAGAVA